jgi:hypothetical protein
VSTTEAESATEGGGGETGRGNPNAEAGLPFSSMAERSRAARVIDLVEAAVCGLAAVGAFALYVLLDMWLTVSSSPVVIAITVLVTAVPAVALLRDRGRRLKAAAIAVIAVAVVAVRFVDWNSRKPFVRDYSMLHAGMTVGEVDAVMGKWIHGTGWPASMEPGAGELEIQGAIVFRHTNEGWGDSDWAIVRFERGRVAAVDFSSD